MGRRVICILGSVGLLLAACGDDGGGNESSSGTDATNATSTASTSSTTTGEASSSATSTSGSTTDSPTSDPTEDPTTTGPACDPEDETAIAECIELALDESGCTEVAECNCQSCVCPLLDCQMDRGCTDIRQCAQDTECLGIACYAPETCQEVIDANGGPGGSSASLALTLSTCNENAGCPIVCEGATGSSGSSTSGSGSTGTGGGSTSE